MSEKKEQQFAIRFGLGAIKAVGFNVMEAAVKERLENGKFKDVYDFTSRLDPKSINKKSIEALAKCGAFDSMIKNRKQVAESFEILSSYANEKHEESSSNQMNLFGSIVESKPELKKVSDWTKVEKLQKEFEAFGFFLNEHPVDDFIPDLRKRGVIFSDKIERDELEDGNIVKMGGVIAGSKHRSSARGRFAYLTVSDPFGIFEAMIFDEAIITNARDILVDGSSVMIECLIRKDDGGLRILVRDVKKLDDFIRDNKAAAKDFEDIKKQVMRQRKWNGDKNSENNSFSNSNQNREVKREEVEAKVVPVKNAVEQIKITLIDRDAIFKIKAFLAAYPAPISSDAKTTKVFLTVGEKMVELPQKYSLDESDVARLRKIDGIVIA
jgi:DNA polymerase III alpha subunit